MKQPQRKNTQQLRSLAAYLISHSERTNNWGIAVAFCGIFHYVEFPTDSLEYRIRELCARAIAAPESEWEPILSELRSLIHDHVSRARDLAAAAFPRGNDAA